jgi:hypothetical protein
MNDPLIAPAGRSPLPPRASSIDLEDSEHLVQPDHDTSYASVDDLSAPFRGTPLFYTRGIPRQEVVA